jgi:phosphotransferase system enzyme I (PtsI)
MPGDAQMEKRLRGVPLSEGIAVARVCMFNERRHSNLPVYRVGGSGVERELLRVDRAIELGVAQLDEIRLKVESQIGKAESEIFVAQTMILQDPGLLAKIRGVIQEKALNAESAVAAVLDADEARLQEVDNEYIRERATDIGEIKRRLLDSLGNMRLALQCEERRCQKGRNRIIISEELTPGMTVELDAGHVMGFVTERGGPTSHSAILARALQIPAVGGIAGIRDMVGCGSEILINGATGEVVLWPSERTILEMKARWQSAVIKPTPVDPVPGLKVLANVSHAIDLAEAQEMKADGIGLYRTEIEVILAGRMPSIDELAGSYAGAVRAMNGRPTTFRVFDIGSDKPLTFLNMPREINPALGWRGGRLLLGNRDLLQLQSRALAMASREGPVQVMYPMVIDRQQFIELRTVFEEAVRDVHCGVIRHGVMFEVPSACLDAGDIYSEADFGSIGTNDLIQYMFAVDRSNESVAYDFRNDREVLWRLMGMVLSAARAAGKPLSICGELAGDPDHAVRLMEMGFDTLSVSPRRISVVRLAVEHARQIVKRK